MMKKRILLKQQENVDVKVLEKWYEQLLSIDEFSWGMFEFTREMLREKICDEEKKRFIEQSILCGTEWAEEMINQFGLVNQEKINRSWYLAKKLNLSITFRSCPPTKFRMIFAQFIMDRSIEIIDEPISAYTSLTKNSNSLPESNLVQGILIAHEIFHYLEEQYGESMFHLTKTIPLWRFFNYEHRSTVGCASEIAAMAFAKKLCDVEFVPQVLDVLLSYSLEVNFSKSIYDVIMEKMRDLKNS